MIKITKMPELKYFEREDKFTLEINGKKVIVSKYQKQDPIFSDYDSDILIENEEALTEEEIKEIKDFMEDK